MNINLSECISDKSSHILCNTRENKYYIKYNFVNVYLFINNVKHLLIEWRLNWRLTARISWSRKLTAPVDGLGDANRAFNTCSSSGDNCKISKLKSCNLITIVMMMVIRSKD